MLRAELTPQAFQNVQAVSGGCFAGVGDVHVELRGLGHVLGEGGDAAAQFVGELKWCLRRGSLDDLFS